MHASYFSPLCLCYEPKSPDMTSYSLSIELRLMMLSASWLFSYGPYFVFACLNLASRIYGYIASLHTLKFIVNN